MTKIPNITDIRAGHFNQDSLPEESTVKPEAVILEMKREQRYRVEHTRRMAELKKITALQEKVITRILERSIEITTLTKRPPLKIIE